MNKFISITAGLITATLAPIAVAEDLSVSISIDYNSEYVFRGVSLARGALQPGIEISKNGFTAGVWSSTAIGEASAIAGDEIDIYAGYSWAPSSIVSADIGATIYHYPDIEGNLLDFGNASTFEVYGGLGFDVPLSPTIYTYYDFDLEALTVEGGFSKNMPVAEKTTLDLSLTAGLVSLDNGTDYEYGAASANINYELSDSISFKLGANYALSSTESLNFRRFTNLATGSDFAATTDKSKFWLGLGVSANF